MSGSGARSTAGTSCGMAFVVSLDASDGPAIGGHFSAQIAQLLADIVELCVDPLEPSIDPLEPLVYPFESLVDAVEPPVDLVESSDLRPAQHRTDPDQDHRVDPECNRRFHIARIHHYRTTASPLVRVGPDVTGRLGGRSSERLMVDVEDRIGGGLLGVAAGDALGATLEFMTAPEIRRRFGTHREITGGGPFRWRPGQGTDDTDLTWAVLAAYLDGPYDLGRVAANMLAWFHKGPRDIGGATARALGRLDRTGDPRTSGNTGERSCGNGSLMRCIPTALARPDPDLRRRELIDISAITHAHVQCTDSCLAYGEIVNALLEAAEVPDALAAARVLDLHPKVREALDIDAALPVERLRTSGYVIDSLACAVWAIQQEASFEEVIVALVNRGRDTDTTGAIAGGLMGVLVGVEAIPARWRRELEYQDRLVAAVPVLVAIRS